MFGVDDYKMVKKCQYMQHSSYTETNELWLKDRSEIVLDHIHLRFETGFSSELTAWTWAAAASPFSFGVSIPARG